ncbi:hypothetical protein K488DRAFT_91984 [Vararia minispora EC-137]|uniref:Uncharacterized protein n=1 Tax=Vararia minispora EC-137 TaxID=1314806 RepID=A0ACB8Q4L7_9AGAM|nr:hypothetical protein K488DRAFT_91984 [Vararia minispora EC-137]
MSFGLAAREAASAAPTVGNTVGALVVGWGVSSIAFGMICLQVWTYYSKYPSDALVHKLLVAVIGVSEIVHQVAIGHACWHYTVTDNGKGLLIFSEKSIWSLATVVVLGAFIGTVVKIYFGLRTYKLSKGNYLVSALIVRLPHKMHRTELIIFGIYSIKSQSMYMAQLADLKNLGSVALGLGAATDIVTALALSYYLHTMRTGYRRSDTLINRLILFSVNTGALTSACSLSVLIVYQVMPSNFVFISLYFLLCKLYSNSCLATFNSRRFVSGRGTDRSETNSNGNGAFALAPRSRNATIADFKSADVSKVNRQIAIGVRQEVAVKHDSTYDEYCFKDAASPAY